MRKVTVSNTAIKEAYRTGGRKPLYVNGSDEDTGELVRFAADAIKVAEFSVRADYHDDPAAELTLDVGDADVIEVTPVSGEWDSPGTSPEEYDDETF